MAENMDDLKIIIYLIRTVVRFFLGARLWGRRGSRNEGGGRRVWLEFWGEVCDGARRLDLGWGSFRWLLGIKEFVGWRLQIITDMWGGEVWLGKIWKWNSCCRLGKVKLHIRNEVRAEDMGKKRKIWGNYISRSDKFSGIYAVFGKRAVGVCCWGGWNVIGW